MQLSRTTQVSLLATVAIASSLHAQEEAAPEESAPAPALAETLDPTVGPALATDLPAEPKPAAAAPSENVTINLINRLVQKGILSQEEAKEMIQQAEADAATAAAQKDISALPPEPAPEDEVRIAYIPDVVRNQMRDQIQQELMAQAREEKWSEKEYPEWTSRLKPFGDFRLRSENTFFPDGNDNTGAFPNFQAINTGAPYDTSGTQFSPQLNVDQDRHRARIRARFGTEFMLGDGFNGGIRLATGSDNSPTTTNQSLGGSGGNFSRYAIWLDRAFVSYDAGPGDGEELLLLLGRFDNPFLSSEVMWDNDVGFDGLALRGKVRVHDKVSTTFAAGYFPVYNTDFNFSSNQPSKFESTDKWLMGAQIGVEWKPTDDLTARFGIAYYDFDGVEGKLSSPYIPLAPNDAGDTDTTRPSFAQRGNTYRELRNIDNSTAANDFGNKFQYQYYGLATPFENLTITSKVDYDGLDPFRVSFIGEFIKNVAFDSADIDAIAVNNRGPSAGAGKLGNFEGGDTAWFTSVVMGDPALEKMWDWQAGLGYRYVESDAVMDAFTDSNFGGGGTNVQGFTLGANIAITRAARWGVRWMSADEIAGPALSSDILQIDFNAKF
ncbi:MAG: putative porin [Akkermansiaceae bacterium]|nr:putative porin [Akkermansiaceae bacterium]